MINSICIGVSRGMHIFSGFMQNLRELRKKRLRIVDAESIRLSVISGKVVLRYYTAGYHKEKAKPLRLIESSSLAFIKDKLKILNIG